jgi:hypothetical protein
MSDDPDVRLFQPGSGGVTIGEGKTLGDLGDAWLSAGPDSVVDTEEWR